MLNPQTEQISNLLGIFTEKMDFFFKFLQQAVNLPRLWYKTL